MSFYAELKQRKVFRVGAAYLVVAWLAVQVASIALPAFDAPDWLMRVFILVLALGFPLALLLSWAFELGPDGPSLAAGARISRRLLAVCLLLVLGALGWYFLAQPALQRQLSAEQRSIAVLPFVNMGGDRNNEYFSDGLAETTLDMLARVPSLKVIARSSSFSFRDDSLDVADVGRQLDVAHLLQGSVQQAGDRVRVSVQLVRAADGAQLWSQRFDRKLTDVFAIQDEIARAVVDAIRVSLPEGGAQALTPGGTRNVAAYEEFLRGNKLLWTRQVADMRQAKAHFEKAVALDAEFMQAQAMALMAQQMIGSNTGTLAMADVKRLKQGYDEVLSRQPGLAEAYVGRANVRQRLDDLEGSLQDYRKGIELKPSFAVAYQWLAEALFYFTEDVDGASSAFQRAMELDPITPQIRLAYARALTAQNRSAEALALLKEVHDKHPGNDNVAMDYSRLLMESGDNVGGLRVLHRAGAEGGDAMRMQVQICLALVALTHEAASTCLDRLPVQAAGDPTAHYARLYLPADRGEIAEVKRIIEGLGIPKQELDPVVLVMIGEQDVARQSIETNSPGLLASPPQLRGLDVLRYPTVARLLFETGQDAQARALLQAGIARFRNAPLQGEMGRGWTEVSALAMLGEDAGACNAMQGIADSGFRLYLAELRTNPRLGAFRDTACYRQTEAAILERNRADVAQARKQGLLPPGV